MSLAGEVVGLDRQSEREVVPTPSRDYDMLAGALVHSEAALLIVDRAGRVKFVSPGALRRFQWPSDIVGASVLELLANDERERASDGLARHAVYTGPSLGPAAFRFLTGNGDEVEAAIEIHNMTEVATDLVSIAFLPDTDRDRRDQESLRDQLRVETYAARIGAELLEDGTPAEVMGRVAASLGQVAWLCSADAVRIYLEQVEGDQFQRIAEWVHPDHRSSGRWDTLEAGVNLRAEDLEHVATRPFNVADLGDVADDLAGIGLLSHPISVGQQRGFIGMHHFGSRRAWRRSDALALERMARTYERALQALISDELLYLTFTHAPIGFSIRTVSGHLVECNDEYLAIHGRTRHDPGFQQVRDVFHPDDVAQVASINDRFWSGDDEQVVFDARIVRGDGEVRWTRARLMRVEGAVSGETFSFASVEDITESMDQQARLEHAATHDALTGVANRAAMVAAIEHSQVSLGRLPNLVLVDLDRFKLTNDSLGHLTGDRVLLEVVERLAKEADDDGIVARLGGDEFAVVVPELDDEMTIDLAERLRRSVEAPLIVDGRSTTQTISLGIALGRHCADSAELLIRADRAMYEAKALGRNRQVVFDATMREEVAESLQLERELRHALDHGELVVYFQPEFSVVDRSIVGAEALVRWHHPERGLLPAGRFIEVAEQSGMIDEIGRLALREACLSFMVILDRCPNSELSLRVNLSAREFGRPELATLVQAALADSGLAPGRLCLEMTEMTLMDAPELADQTLTRLRRLGVEFAIDDFGTGYSSLAYLKRLPVDALKIDKSFIEDITTNRDSRAIVDSIIGLSDAMGLSVVAEGIETEEQLAIVSELGCPRAQGYLVAPAIDVDTFVALVHGNSPDAR